METYSNEIVCLQHNKQLHKDSSLISLAPILDSNGLLRLGGRLKNAKLTSGEKMPIIISGCNYIAALIVRHFRQLCSSSRPALHRRSDSIQWHLVDRRKTTN